MEDEVTVHKVSNNFNILCALSPKGTTTFDWEHVNCEKCLIHKPEEEGE